MWKRSINSEERKLTHEIYDLPANLNALVIMINTSVRNIPTTAIQKQWYCEEFLQHGLILTASLAAQSAFSIPLDTFHRLISVGFALQHYLVHCPTLTSPLKPVLCPFLPCTLTTLIHHMCPCANSCMSFIHASSIPRLQLHPATQKKKILWRTKNWKNNIP